MKNKNNKNDYLKPFGETNHIVQSIIGNKYYHKLRLNQIKELDLIYRNEWDETQSYAIYHQIKTNLESQKDNSKSNYSYKKIVFGSLKTTLYTSFYNKNYPKKIGKFAYQFV